MKKTNAMRELDKAKIPYQYHEYEVDEDHLGALDVAFKMGQDSTKIFKTLVLWNEKKEIVVACIPGNGKIDLKKIAKLAQSKKVEMIEMKQLFPMTGYIRGGCSPIGMKKKYRMFLHQSALTKKSILISAGIRGLQLELDPRDLLSYLKMEIGDIVGIEE